MSVTYRISVSDLEKINYASLTHHTRYLLHFHPATSTIASISQDYRPHCIAPVFLTSRSVAGPPVSTEPEAP